MTNINHDTLNDINELVSTTVCVILSGSRKNERGNKDLIARIKRNLTKVFITSPPRELKRKAEQLVCPNAPKTINKAKRIIFLPDEHEMPQLVYALFH